MALSYTTGNKETRRKVEKGAPSLQDRRNKYPVLARGVSDTSRDRSDAGTGDLFAWGAKRSSKQNRSSRPAQSAGWSAYGLDRSVHRPPSRSRLTNYLYSGSFGRGDPGDAWDDDVVRNRRLFLAVFVGMVGVILFTLIFR